MKQIKLKLTDVMLLTVGISVVLEDQDIELVPEDPSLNQSIIDSLSKGKPKNTNSCISRYDGDVEENINHYLGIDNYDGDSEC